ncbi:tetratricopeptide repeat-containing sulfotransferase family protein [Dyella sp. C9]|uniref:tetratricopeptide repeat-containing sulfotransferase family protein n=1 Tax=Dyella sp. C9 TaxID=2202154 RepID=UPI000DEFFDE9|nr:tetratricopeptide repeat-containing sulfotransferase family protein [Dyella sp. C9]
MTGAAGNSRHATTGAQALLAAYRQASVLGSVAAARRQLLDQLATANEQDCLACGRALVLDGQFETALEVFARGATRHVGSAELQLGLAGLCWQMQRPDEAEHLLRQWLSNHPRDIPASFLLARLLREQGRVQAAAEAVLRPFEPGPQDTDTLIQAIELLDDYGRPSEASLICEAAIAAGEKDPRVHAYAGMLGIQLGQFQRVRERYEFALANDANALEWNIPIGLSGLQRYKEAEHPDFALFRAALARPELSDKARTTTLFALGKAYDDIGDYARATRYLRDANARAHATGSWSRKHWKRLIEARLAAAPYPFALPAPAGWIPVFVVGVPRSGTTLLAELLARHPMVCNRGELGWLKVIAERLSTARFDQRSAFEEAAALYATQLRQDDSNARWFIDKQPLNLLHVDLVLSLWPNARIIHCERDARDTALSLWTQSFHDQAHDYAYDFDDIAAVIQGCRRLMAHWGKRYPDSIRTVGYEALVTAPAETISALASWLGLPDQEATTPPGKHHGISTASAWQARQPVYTRSAGRWRDYAGYLPELSRIPRAGG